MQTHLQKLQERRFLITTLILVVAVNIIANYFSEFVAILVGNFVYIPVAASLVAISIMSLNRLGSTGKHGTAWIALIGFSISWFIAEMIWIFQELVIEIDPFPSAADVFYLLGYPFLLMFLISYIEPVRKAITKKMLMISISVSISILMPSLYYAVQYDSEMPLLDTVFAGAYPVADAFVIIPAFIGIALFFKGRVNFMWTLVCLGILSTFVADIVFLFAHLNDWYYTGHPMEILFHLAYILIAFGVYDHMKVFSKDS